MSESPNPIDKRFYMRIGMWGAILGTVSIGLFIALWVLLDSIAVFPRLIIAVCTAPLLMTLFLGGYYIMIQAKKDNQD